MTAATATKTEATFINVWIGRCIRCKSYATQSYLPDVHIDHGCPKCGGWLNGHRVKAKTTNKECNALCTGATGTSCNCSCGGENHGMTHRIA